MTFELGNTRTRVGVLAISIFATSFGAPAQAEDWPCWRGPRRDGISRETGLLQEWPKGGPRQLWKANLSGGFSSVVVADGGSGTQSTKQVRTGGPIWTRDMAAVLG